MLIRKVQQRYGGMVYILYTIQHSTVNKVINRIFQQRIRGIETTVVAGNEWNGHSAGVDCLRIEKNI